MTRTIANALLAGGFILACGSGTASAQQKVFGLSSTTFKDGTMLPAKAANSKANAPNNANCVGENVSPQLSWVNPPDGTKSFVLLMEDPEGRAPAGVHHMVIYGIAPTVTGFAEGELSKASDKFVGGKATQGTGTYNGPCTPANVQPHHYTFVLIATDLDPKELPPGLTREELTPKIVPPGGAAHAKGSAGIVGLFVKPN
ncbi:MAG: YbhB/YbcL family Raf kinase inhibitor-like protein [Hyphomicrobiaceae bacterium]|nr:YbhB/YbcL family Raf kinase inhibitor-like protein [Hyphomicrobiaceae bacterium]